MKPIEENIVRARQALIEAKFWGNPSDINQARLDLTNAIALAVRSNMNVSKLRQRLNIINGK